MKRHLEVSASCSFPPLPHPSWLVLFSVGSASHEDEEGGSSSRPPHKALQPSSSFDLPQYKATHLSGSKPSESHARVEAEPFRWPGIEVLLDAYQRHVQGEVPPHPPIFASGSQLNAFNIWLVFFQSKHWNVRCWLNNVADCKRTIAN